MGKTFNLPAVALLILIIFWGNANAQWVQTNGPRKEVNAFAKLGNNLFVSTWDGGVYLLSNDGLNWIEKGLANKTLSALAACGNCLFAGGLGVYVSTDNGTNWTAANNGLVDQYGNTLLQVETFAVKGNIIFVGTYTGVYISTNYGGNWEPANNGLGDNWVRVFAVNGDNIYAGTNNDVFLSTDNGSNWKNVSNGMLNPVISSLTISGNNIFVGTFGDYHTDTYGVIYRKTIYDTTWKEVNNRLVDILSLFAYDNYIFAGVQGIYLSADSGAHWQNISYNLYNFLIYTLTEYNNNIYAYESSNNCVWYLPISKIKDNKNDLPNDFSLEQNYPNPFNPTTTIKYTIPKSNFVTLKVYDVLGKEIQTLVNEEKPAGSYEVEFNGSKYSSGIYFYQLQPGSYSSVKKMILLK